MGERVERKNHKKETKQVSFCFLGLVSLVSRGTREAGGKSGFGNWELGAWTIEDVALSGGHDLGQARPSHTAGCHAPAAATTCRTLHSQKLRHRRCCHSRCRHKPAAWPCYACMPVDLWTPSICSVSQPLSFKPCAGASAVHIAWIEDEAAPAAAGNLCNRHTAITWKTRGGNCKQSTTH